MVFLLALCQVLMGDSFGICLDTGCRAFSILYVAIQILVTSFDGITRDLIITSSYKVGEYFPIIADLNGDGLIKSLCVSFILLLDGDIKLINKEEFYNG